jgi:hypothetical protein
LLDVKKGVTWEIDMNIGSAAEGKIKMSVCLNKHSTSKACMEGEAFLHLFVDGGEWLTSRPCRKRADRGSWMLRRNEKTLSTSGIKSQFSGHSDE